MLKKHIYKDILVIRLTLFLCSNLKDTWASHTNILGGSQKNYWACQVDTMLKNSKFVIQCWA